MARFHRLSKTTLFALLLGLAMAPGAASAAEIPADVDQSESSLTFEAFTSLFDVTGRFDRWKIEGTVDPDDFTKSDVTVKIDAATIDTDNSTRDEHLRSEDFFDVDDYPHITFETTDISKLKPDVYRVTGNFTIKDNTREVTIPMEVKRVRKNGREYLRVRGNLTVDRFDYGLDYEAGFFEPDLERKIKIRIDVALRL